MIHVLIVSDIRVYREGLADILDRHASLSVRGTAKNTDLAIEEIKLNIPDVVILDMNMSSSCKVIESIASSSPVIKIVALSVTEDEDVILSCAKAGVVGYVSREASVEELINTVCAVVDGEIYCPRRIAARLFHKLKTPHSVNEDTQDLTLNQDDESKRALLTQREKQIADQMTNGLSNKQIARNLCIELSTVKNHVHNILVKMGVENRVQAARVLSCGRSS